MSTETVKRVCYLVFDEFGPAVKCFSKPPNINGVGQVAMRVEVAIPASYFNPIKLVAKINLPPNPGLANEVFIDLQEAIGMSYGGKVVLKLEPADGTGESAKAAVAASDH